MNSEHKDVTYPASLNPQEAGNCILDAEGHCVTCSDEAREVHVLSVDEGTGLALVEENKVQEEVDITLIDNVAPGDLLLVHGGVAIGRPGKMSGEA